MYLTVVKQYVKIPPCQSSSKVGVSVLGSLGLDGRFRPLHWARSWFCKQMHLDNSIVASQGFMMRKPAAGSAKHQRDFCKLFMLP